MFLSNFFELKQLLKNYYELGAACLRESFPPDFVKQPRRSWVCLGLCTFFSKWKVSALKDTKI